MMAALEAAALAAGPHGHDPPAHRRLSAFLEGFSLHAATKVHENDRQGRERLCLYGARGPLALSRLEELDDGRFSYRMKRATPDGRTHLVLEGVELLKKLAPLIPPPRVNLTRYHGVFAPNAKARRSVVQLAREEATTSSPAATSLPLPSTAPPRTPSPYRLDWAALLKRVFGTDVLACGRCGGRMKVLAFVTGRKAITRILTHLDLPPEPPALERARGPPQEELDC